MLVIMLVAVVVSSICMNYAVQCGKLTTSVGEGGLSAQLAITAGIAVGLALFLGATFMIEMYGESRLDFWDYGKITVQGIVYMSARILGAICVAENLIALATLAVKEIKDEISNS